MAHEAGIPNSAALTSHALRRGVAHDVLDAGGSLAVFLRSGDWTSNAYKAYLRAHQPEEVALPKAVIFLSESEEED